MTIWTKYAQATALRWTSHEDTADRRRKKRKEHHGPTPGRRTVRGRTSVLLGHHDPHDDEDLARIHRHVADRAGMDFITVERSFDLPAALPALDRHGTVLFDSVTACLSEQMFPGPAPDADAANRVLRELLDISRYPAHFIAVCDDIWHGGEDYRDWTEVYVRGLADICQGLAAEFDVVCEMTAGLPHLWKGELPRV